MKTIYSKYSNNKWLPTSIPTLKIYLGKFFKTGKNVQYVSAIISNLSYNIQYLQFQSQLFTEITPTSVVIKQTRKAYIIIGTSIIECILYYLLKSKNFYKTKEWEIIGKTSNQTRLDKSEIYKIETRILKKITNPIPIEMKFGEMIKVVQKKLVNPNNETCKKLNYLKKLRNRIHLQSVEHYADTDWYKFKANDTKTVKSVLRFFLTSNLFQPTSEEKKIFDFLL